MSREELEKLTATKLRETAQEYPDIQGASAMNKEDLIVAILKARGEPVGKKKKDVVEISKVKKHIKATKQEKNKALDAGELKKVKKLRKEIKRMKRQTRHLASLKKQTAAEEKSA